VAWGEMFDEKTEVQKSGETVSLMGQQCYKILYPVFHLTASPVPDKHAWKRF
jgi:hypothetical protein